MPRTAMPWTWRDQPQGDRVLVFASRFDGASVRQGWTLLRHSLRIRRQVLATPGAVGVALYARPLRGTYYTYTAWRDEAALHEFARSKQHREGVLALRALGDVTGVLLSWWEDGAGWQPGWGDVLQRTSGATPGPYAGPGAAVSRAANPSAA